MCESLDWGFPGPECPCFESISKSEGSRGAIFGQRAELMSLYNHPDFRSLWVI